MKDNFVKYDIKICRFSEAELCSSHNPIDIMQEEGWEICGAIGVPQNPTWCGEKSITVPFKRKKLNHENEKS